MKTLQAQTFLATALLAVAGPASAHSVVSLPPMGTLMLIDMGQFAQVTWQSATGLTGTRSMAPGERAILSLPAGRTFVTVTVATGRRTQVQATREVWIPAGGAIATRFGQQEWFGTSSPAGWSIVTGSFALLPPPAPVFVPPVRATRPPAPRPPRTHAAPPRAQPPVTRPPTSTHHPASTRPSPPPQPTRPSTPSQPPRTGAPSRSGSPATHSPPPRR